MIFMQADNVRTGLPDWVVQENGIDEDWLKSATPEEQYEALFQWFTNQYEDPVHSLPYISREGGYQYIYGDPVDPSDEFGQFYGIVPDGVIQDVIQELYDIAGDGWTPKFYELKETPYDKFISRISKVMSLLEMGDEFLIKSSVFSFLFTAFETYLWEKTKECLNDKRINIRSNLIGNMGEFKNKKYSLSEVYDMNINFEDRLNEILDKETVWHNINKIELIFKRGFELEHLPNFGHIEKFLKKRHDIVHRFGMSDGYEMPLEIQEIRDLKNELHLYVQELEQYISNKLLDVDYANEKTHLRSTQF